LDTGDPSPQPGDPVRSAYDAGADAVQLPLVKRPEERETVPRVLDGLVVAEHDPRLLEAPEFSAHTSTSSSVSSSSSSAGSGSASAEESLRSGSTYDTGLGKR